MIDFVGLGVLLILTLLFAFLAYRAWGSRNAILKWVGLVLSGLLTLLFAAVLVMVVMGTLKLNQNYNASHPPQTITVSMAPENIARGQALAKTCTGCHGVNNDFPLTGNDFAAGFPAPVGTLWSANLTPAGDIGKWTDGEVLRALREGVHQSGRSLIIMPSYIFHNLSDQDAQAIVAFLRSQPPAGQPHPPAQLNAVAAFVAQLSGDGIFTVQPPITQPVPMPEVGVNTAYGDYMANILGCTDCHGADFGGGTPGGFTPAGPTIRDLGKRYTNEQFLNVFRTGIKSSGQPLTGEMPWKDYSALNDTDLSALYQYLSSLPPK